MNAGQLAEGFLIAPRQLATEIEKAAFIYSCLVGIDKASHFVAAVLKR